MFFRVEGNFSSPASPERRGGGKGAGRYARHPAAKGIKDGEKRLKDKGKGLISFYEGNIAATDKSG